MIENKRPQTCGHDNFITYVIFFFLSTEAIGEGTDREECEYAEFNTKPILITLNGKTIKV